MERDGKMGVQLDVSNGYAGRLEVVEGPTGRRQRSAAERARIAAEGLLPGVRVTDVARRHGVTRWQVTDDLARAHAAGIHGDHLVIEARKTALVSGDQLRIEAGFPVAGNLHLEAAAVRRHRLLAVAVAAIAGLVVAI